MVITLKDRQTTITGYNGKTYKGYRCTNACTGCPYITMDDYGNDACYADDYQECDNPGKSREIVELK